jgi:elongator complex protein 3
VGGTFLSLDKEYKDYFIRNFDTLSGYHSQSVAGSGAVFGTAA